MNNLPWYYDIFNPEIFKNERKESMTREEVINIAKGLLTDFKVESDTMVDFCNTIIKMLEQEPKTGHWIMKHRTHNEIKHYTGQDEMGETHTISVLERYEADEPYCSECGKRAGDTSQNYCCACGAKMIDPQESEEA